MQEQNLSKVHQHKHVTYCAKKLFVYLKPAYIQPRVQEVKFFIVSQILNRTSNCQRPCDPDILINVALSNTSTVEIRQRFQPQSQKHLNKSVITKPIRYTEYLAQESKISNSWLNKMYNCTGYSILPAQHFLNRTPATI